MGLRPFILVLFVVIAPMCLTSRRAGADATCEDHCDTHDGAFEGCGDTDEYERQKEACIKECRSHD